MTQTKISARKLYGLLALAALLVAVHISLVLRQPDDSNLINGSILVWFVCGLLVWEKRKQPLEESSRWFKNWANSWANTGAKILGWGIVTIVLVVSFSLTSYHTFIRFAPFLICLGLGLIAAGFGGLQRYKQELTLTLLTALPPGLVHRLADWEAITANLSHFLLQSLGFDAHLGYIQKEIVLTIGAALPTANNSVIVARGCAGVEMMLQLWVLSIAGIFLLPTSRRQKLIIPVAAVVMAYIINAIRVAVLAVIVPYPLAFNYWHTGQGGQIFPVFAVLIWGVLCKLLLDFSRSNPHKHPNKEQNSA